MKTVEIHISENTFVEHYGIVPAGYYTLSIPNYYLEDEITADDIVWDSNIDRIEE